MQRCTTVTCFSAATVRCPQPRFMIRLIPGTGVVLGLFFILSGFYRKTYSDFASQIQVLRIPTAVRGQADSVNAPKGSHAHASWHEMVRRCDDDTTGKQPQRTGQLSTLATDKQPQMTGQLCVLIFRVASKRRFFSLRNKALSSQRHCVRPVQHICLL